jgi:poly-gamma-glutamate synthesis protein (capsule biosynthesis protein)
MKIIGIENNHSFDLGDTGKLNTIKKKKKNEIHPVCFENSPYFISVKGIVFSIVTVNTVPDRNNSKNPIYSIELRQKLALAKRLANVVIVSIHWGSELLEWSNKTQREEAEWLIAQGADIIIGSHPHVVQNPEIIDGKPVFFSLGNHLFDQKYPATKKGLIVEVTVKNGKYQCKGIITHTKPNSFYPEWAASVSFDFPVFEYNSKLLTLNEYSFIPISVFEQNKTMVVLQAYCNDRLKWCSHPMPLVYITSAKIDGKEEYLVLH